MKTLKLTRVGDHMSGNLYKDEEGRYYVDDIFSHIEIPSVVYRLSPAFEPDGDPDFPITCGFEITNPPTEKEWQMGFYRHDYMMLDRMRTDCEYYHDAEHYNRSHFSTIQQTIEEMKKIWNKFPADLKPEWITWEQILGYEKKFCA